MTSAAEGAVSIAQRIDALEEVANLSEAYLPAEQIQGLRAVVERTKGRLRHGTHHTVVALAGPTGAGKSSLFNALIGEEVSVAGVRRPTTGSAHACVFGQQSGPGAGELLDWLSIGQRHYRDAGPELDGLILVDLPDHDSTEETNRMEVDRLVELVDLLVWVVDPQKYADHALHAGYLRPLSAHSSVMRFVLSKADTLDEASLEACVADFAALLVSDGIADPTVVTTSLEPSGTDLLAAAGTGAGAVQQMLMGEVSSQRAVVERLSADLSQAVAGLALGDGSLPGRRAERSAQAELVTSLGKAAGVDRVASTVAEQHLHEARLVTGWPVTRWIHRLRRRPIRDLPVARTSTVASAEVGLALRSAGEAAAAGVDSVWAPAMRRRAEAQQDAVLGALDTMSHKTTVAHRSPPKWWSMVAGLQRVLLGGAVLGLVWLIALAMIDGFFRIDVDLAVPTIGEMPLPTLMVFAGVLLGLLSAAIARLAARVGAKRRARGVRQDFELALVEVADTHVNRPLDAVAADYGRIRQFATTARGA